MSQTPADTTFASQELRSIVAPHLERIAQICDAGGVAVVIHEPSGRALSWLQDMGWREEPVCPISPIGRAALSAVGGETEAWLAQEATGIHRAYVMVGDRIVLANIADGHVWEVGDIV